ncbi:hypothetical protein [Acinetobacter sp. 243_ASPC]|uniref:hypothetical protein n=1 Tax=Acinetobacter sp. 243_ASPC TaxID=1579345 RepID=UPI000660DFFE|nr:hypothetical protein [Acinetobacter sp. 243_ASPC]
MSEQFNEYTLEVVKQITLGDKANRLLIGNLARILIEKGLIDLNEYLSSINDLKEGVKEHDTPVEQSELIEAYFDIHINDFKSPT